MENEFEAKLSAAADKLGLAMKAAPEAEREILKSMYADYQRFVDENSDKQDVSALFAMGIISNNDIKTEDVIKAAVEYIDTDLEYCRWRQKSVCGMEAEFEAKLSAAADKLGLAMKAAPEAEREILKGMYADYQRFVEENDDNQDISALFAMGIISQSGALPCQLIEELISSQRIICSEPVPVKNIQPASLDLRLGKRGWRVEAAFLPRQGEPVSDLLLNNALESLDLSNPVVLQEGCTYVVEIEERFNLPNSVHAYANNKSTTGRMNVWTRVLADGVSRFDKIPPGYKGKIYAMITPRSWSIKVREGNTLNQARLICGDNHLLDFELEMLHQETGLVYDCTGQRGQALIDNGLLLTIDLQQDIVGYKAIPCNEPVDLCSGVPQKGSNYFAPIKAKNGEVLLKRGEFYILSTKEFLRVPPDLAVEMVAYDIHSGEYRSHYAGFFDPGFGYGEDGNLKGTPAVLELDVHEDVLFRHAQPICKMAFEYLLKKPEKIYGSGLGSHYQQQRGPQLGRHFC